MSAKKNKSHSAHVLIYRPELRDIAGSVTAAILLSQVAYWWDKSGGEFYKFKEPCGNPKYSSGDSWCEELGFSPKEFSTAEKKLIQSGLISKRVTMERLSYYKLDKGLLASKLKGIYVNADSAFTKLQNGIYINDETAFCSYTEITTETTTDIKPSDVPPGAEEKKKEVAIKKPKHLDDDKNQKIAEHILGKLRNDNPNLKANIKTWSEDIRKMRSIDGLDAREIVRVFNWANADDFWSSNIRSPQKLRKHFDSLKVKMNSLKSGFNQTGNPGTFDDFAEQAERIAARRRARA